MTLYKLDSIKLSSNHVSKDGKGILGVVVANTGPAINKLLVVDDTEYQLYADEITLGIWESLARQMNENMYVNIGHQELTKIGYMTNVRKEGKTLLADIEFVGPAFDISTKCFGNYVLSTVNDGINDFLNMSLETECEYELDEKNKLALMRPTKLMGVSFVQSGALTEELFAYSSKYQAQNGDTQMSKQEEKEIVKTEVKSDEVKQPVELAKTDEKANDVPVDKAVDSRAQDAEKALDDASDKSKEADDAADAALEAKVDALTALCQSILALLQKAGSEDLDDGETEGDDEDGMVADSMLGDKKAVKAVAMSDKKDVKKVEKKKVEKSAVVVLSDVSDEVASTKKDGEPSDEDLATNPNKYWSTPAYKARIIQLSDLSKIKKKAE